MKQRWVVHIQAAVSSAVTSRARPSSSAPQAWAVWLEEYAEYADAESGEVFDVDWNTEGDLKAVPEDGLRHADTVIERPAFEANWYCLDPDAAGIQVDDTFTRNATGPPTEQPPPRAAVRQRISTLPTRLVRGRKPSRLRPMSGSAARWSL